MKYLVKMEEVEDILQVWTTTIIKISTKTNLCTTMTDTSPRPKAILVHHKTTVVAVKDVSS